MSLLILTFPSVTFPTAPCTVVTEKGEIKYSEVVRENVRNLKPMLRKCPVAIMFPVHPESTKRCSQVVVHCEVFARDQQ